MPGEIIGFTRFAGGKKINFLIGWIQWNAQGIVVFIATYYLGLMIMVVAYLEF